MFRRPIKFLATIDELQSRIANAMTAYLGGKNGSIAFLQGVSFVN